EEAWKKAQQASRESAQACVKAPKRSPLHSPKRAILHTISDLTCELSARTESERALFFVPSRVNP
ncbi:hypothetical protein AB1399_00435, partial [Hydrogenibacillus schlegelii]|uniref:hypothetical protein n=1 Tax=Hydrogenibacillus schlegelii TaxID=1484 RepID=UPI001B808040